MYLYQADLYCDDCGALLCERRDSEDEGMGCLTSGDSDDYPQIAEVLRVAHPTCCKGCGCLMGTLTADGVAYVLAYLRAPAATTAYRAELATVARENTDRRSDVVLAWMSFYDIAWPKDLYTIKIEPSDDPFQMLADVQGPYADEWCDAMGSLDGGTWECCDGPTFCYDILSWREVLIAELIAEGYTLDLSEWSDPGEEETAIAKHAGTCDECQGDYRQAERHLS